MNKKRALEIAFVISLVATVLVGIVYAASLTLYSPTYDYTAPPLVITATIENSVDGSSWSTTGFSGSGTDWFCRLKTTATGYSGSAVITWQLQKSADGTTWNQVAGASVSSSVTFTGVSGQDIYATSDGSETGNRNWVPSFTGTAKYRVQVSITY